MQKFLGLFFFLLFYDLYVVSKGEKCLAKVVTEKNVLREAYDNWLLGNMSRAKIVFKKLKNFNNWYIVI